MVPVLRNGHPFSPAASHPFNRLDSLFDRVFGDEGRPATQTWAGPPLAMWEDDDHIRIEAELPGVSEQDVEIVVQDGMLLIRAERKPVEGRRYLYNGRAWGRFERSIMLPEAIDAAAVRATLNDGILSLDLPKSPEAKPRKIAVTRG